MEESENNNEKLNGVMDLVIDIRKDARTKKDFAISDKIRDALPGVGIQLKDSKDLKTRNEFQSLWDEINY
jgi:cysteinyl-tRNA synthetase